MTYQGYDINGYMFYTKQQDKKSTYQNSGVRVDAYDAMGVFVVFPVRWPGRRVFWNTNLCIESRKMTSTPQVDMEELKRQLRRDVLGDLRPILEASGIQFPNIDAVMSDEEHRSSLASIAARGGWPHEDL
jgi:hypothetical protein